MLNSVSVVSKTDGLFSDEFLADLSFRFTICPRRGSIPLCQHRVQRSAFVMKMLLT